jgi:chemosensory pili system protein ChpA (sensor histidine kinase/response regulator)
MTNSSISPNNTGTSPRVLLAEDDLVTQALLARLIREEHLEPVLASDGRQALELLQQGGPFAAAVFDVQMPHLSGLEVMRFMRQEPRLQQIPVMVITSSLDLQHQLEGRAYGSLVFINKPVLPRSFQTLLKTIVAQRPGASS